MDLEKEINLKYSICSKVCERSFPTGKDYRRCMVDCFNAVFVKSVIVSHGNNNPYNPPSPHQS